MAGTCAPGSRSAGSMHAVLPRVALSTADARREFSLNSTTPGPVRLGLVGRILLASCATWPGNIRNGPVGKTRETSNGATCRKWARTTSDLSDAQTQRPHVQTLSPLLDTKETRAIAECCRGTDKVVTGTGQVRRPCATSSQVETALELLSRGRGRGFESRSAHSLYPGERGHDSKTTPKPPRSGAPQARHPHRRTRPTAAPENRGGAGRGRGAIGATGKPGRGRAARGGCHLAHHDRQREEGVCDLFYKAGTTRAPRTQCRFLYQRPYAL